MVSVQVVSGLSGYLWRYFWATIVIISPSLLDPGHAFGFVCRVVCHARLYHFPRNSHRLLPLLHTLERIFDFISKDFAFMICLDNNRHYFYLFSFPCRICIADTLSIGCRIHTSPLRSAFVSWNAYSARFMISTVNVYINGIEIWQHISLTVESNDILTFFLYC